MDIRGTYTAMVTPFRGENADEVDYSGFRKNIKFQLDSKVEGIVPLGTTGESPTLTHEEKTRIIELAVREAKGKAVVLVGTGSYSTKQTVEATKQAKELGADAALIVTPYYNKPTNEGIYRHFKAVSDSADIPVVVYNIQGRTGKNIEMPTLKKIAGLRNIAAVKEASGNVSQIMDVISDICDVKKDFSVMSGDDALTFPLMALGGKGVVSVVANIVPAEVKQMVDSAAAGDYKKAREIHYRLMPLFKNAFIETNPIPIKEAMEMMGMPAGKCRLPLCELMPDNRKKLEETLRQLRLLK